MTQHHERPDAPSGEDRLRQAVRRVRVFPRILEIIRDSCSLEDLRNLCFYLGLDDDVLPGDRKMAKPPSPIHHEHHDVPTQQPHRIQPDLEGAL